MSRLNALRLTSHITFLCCNVYFPSELEFDTPSLNRSELWILESTGFFTTMRGFKFLEIKTLLYISLAIFYAFW